MNFFKLVFLNLKLTLLRFLQQIRILPFYSNSTLRKVDWLYFKSYARQNPYRICRDYLKKEAVENPYNYGDTWPSSVPKFILHLPVRKDDVLFDLGAGTGRISFWFHILSGCEVVAVEKVPTFVQKAQAIQKEMGTTKIQFLQEDMLNLDYSRATLIYFYGTSFSDEFIYQLLEKWKDLKPGTRILTTSFYLTEYTFDTQYKLKAEYQVAYPWGTCDVYLQEKMEC